MAEPVQIPKDLSKVKTKVFFRLTKRQLICFSLAAFIGVPSFFICRQWGGNTAASFVMIVVMIPLFFLAMYEKNGKTPEVIAADYVRARFIRPVYRPYIREKEYQEILKAEEERRKEAKRAGKKKGAKKKERTGNCTADHSRPENLS